MIDYPDEPTWWETQTYPNYENGRDYNLSLIVRDDGLTSAYVIGFTEDRKFLKVAGHAKWNPVDIYNRELGIRLAINRALSRFYNRRAKRIVHGTS